MVAAVFLALLILVSPHVKEEWDLFAPRHARRTFVIENNTRRGG
jgi:hypothetical protein